jgi:hypothetical protein
MVSLVGGFAMKMRRLVAPIALVCATLLSSPRALAQFSQQGPKLVGSGAVGQADQGTSVSLSADGNTAIIGGIADNLSAGAAWVWTRSAGVWTQQGSKLVGSGAVGKANQGTSVSLSADGNTAIIGGWADNSAVGAAWVWTRSAGVWTQQGTKLVGSGAVGTSRQGYSVSLSADGNTAIVGGWWDNGNAGAAWVWTRSAGVWTQQGTKLVGSDAVGNADQGRSVSLSADGSTAIVGGYADNGFAGAAWVWTRSAGVWTQQGTKLVGSGAVGAALQGNSASLSADGNTAVIGGMSDNSNAGAAWVWTRSAGVWTQQGSKLVGSGAVGAALLGWKVSLSADGNTAIIGGTEDNLSAGAAWVWTRSAGVWTQQGTKLVGSGAVDPAQQGTSVSLSADGNTAIVGGWQDNVYVGAAWVFTAPGGPPPVGASFHPLTPCRVGDTRKPNGPLDGPALQPNATRSFDVAGVCGIPAGPVAISVNLTVTNGGAPGELVVFPSDVLKPNTSSISFGAGRTRANNAVVVLSGSSTTFSIFNNSAATVDFVLDVNGYFR